MEVRRLVQTYTGMSSELAHIHGPIWLMALTAALLCGVCLLKMGRGPVNYCCFCASNSKNASSTRWGLRSQRVIVTKGV